MHFSKFFYQFRWVKFIYNLNKVICCAIRRQLHTTFTFRLNSIGSFFLIWRKAFYLSFYAARYMWFIIGDFCNLGLTFLIENYAKLFDKY